ncbi:MAG: DinB family protein [Candidatus Latescibacteria bacterium]|nr:DinB family protein [Candidatus Latescibacterota bacterium]
MKRFSSTARARAARRVKPRPARAARRAKPRRVSISPELRAYIRKTDRYRAGRDPIKLQRSAPEKFARAIAGLSAKQMRRRPAPSKWSIIEILGHLHDTEVVYGYRNRLSLSQPGCTILGYDQAEFVRQLRHRRADAKRLIAQDPRSTGRKPRHGAARPAPQLEALRNSQRAGQADRPAQPRADRRPRPQPPRPDPGDPEEVQVVGDPGPRTDLPGTHLVSQFLEALPERRWWVDSPPECSIGCCGPGPGV